MMMSKPPQPLVMMTKSPLLTQEGEEHKTPKVEGVVELQGVEELVKNKVDEGREHLFRKRTGEKNN